ncbi:hypothetical protein Brsp02_03602 [Brucella sp. NBRC 113783]
MTQEGRKWHKSEIRGPTRIWYERKKLSIHLLLNPVTIRKSPLMNNKMRRATRISRFPKNLIPTVRMIE